MRTRLLDQRPGPARPDVFTILSGEAETTCVMGDRDVLAVDHAVMCEAEQNRVVHYGWAAPIPLLGVVHLPVLRAPGTSRELTVPISGITALAWRGLNKRCRRETSSGSPAAVNTARVRWLSHISSASWLGASELPVGERCRGEAVQHVRLNTGANHS